MSQQYVATIPAIWYWLWAVPIGLGLIFTWRYQRDKCRLSNGLWFSATLYSFLAVLAMSILGTENRILIIVSVGLFVIGLMVIGLVFLLQAFLLLWNAWLVWRREQHTLANMLTLWLGLTILLLPWVNRIAGRFLPAQVDEFLVTLVNLGVFYLAFWFYNYLTMLVVYQFNHPRWRQDFIIVLGAGLLNGDQVSPLLRQRIDRGLAFYHKQYQKTGHPVKMIFSGGQGADETVPEGQAMLTYALTQGLPVADGIAEKRSTSTFENLKFSQAIIQASGVTQPRVIFVTNNYHTFRAGMIARQVGLVADGIGSRTAGFFLPNAVLREYLAIFVRNRKWHAVALVLIILLSGLLVWLPTLGA